MNHWQLHQQRDSQGPFYKIKSGKDLKIRFTEYKRVTMNDDRTNHTAQPSVYFVYIRLQFQTINMDQFD